MPSGTPVGPGCTLPSPTAATTYIARNRKTATPARSGRCCWLTFIRQTPAELHGESRQRPDLFRQCSPIVIVKEYSCCRSNADSRRNRGHRSIVRLRARSRFSPIAQVMNGGDATEGQPDRWPPPIMGTHATAAHCWLSRSPSRGPASILAFRVPAFERSLGALLLAAGGSRGAAVLLLPHEFF